LRKSLPDAEAEAKQTELKSRDPSSTTY
jgi:hypothetical protein